jgi:hypothetical protein
MQREEHDRKKKIKSEERMSVKDEGVEMRKKCIFWGGQTDK